MLGLPADFGFLGSEGAVLVGILRGGPRPGTPRGGESGRQGDPARRGRCKAQGAALARSLARAQGRAWLAGGRWCGLEGRGISQLAPARSHSPSSKASSTNSRPSSGQTRILRARVGVEAPGAQRARGRRAGLRRARAGRLGRHSWRIWFRGGTQFWEKSLIQKKKENSPFNVTSLAPWRSREARRTSRRQEEGQRTECQFQQPLLELSPTQRFTDFNNSKKARRKPAGTDAFTFNRNCPNITNALPTSSAEPKCSVKSAP